MTRSTWIRLGIGAAGIALVLGILFSLRRPTAVADRKPDLRDAPVLDGKLMCVAWIALARKNKMILRGDADFTKRLFNLCRIHREVK